MTSLSKRIARRITTASLFLMLAAGAFISNPCAMAAPQGSGATPLPTPLSTAPTNGSVTIQIDKPGATLEPIFYGLMTEEINHSYDGGLYGELIQNRIMMDPVPLPRGRGGRRGGNGGRGANGATSATQGSAPASTPAPTPAPTPDPSIIPHWSVASTQGQGTIHKDTTKPINTVALTTSLRLDILTVASDGRVGVANDGFWGIPVKPKTKYKASFYARASNDFHGPLTVDIESSATGKVYAFATVKAISTEWKKYEVTLSTGRDIEPTSAARFVISATVTGQVWFNLVSLFPPTYKDRPNGNRTDLMQLLADMHPGFLRFPGGNYLEGRDWPNRFQWQQTIGPLENRPGHQGPWGYRSSDGMGLLEFLNWCEDLKIEPILAVFAGHTLNGQVVTGKELDPYVQEALEEIEYVTGDKSTTWGARRAADGHPAPFKLRYVEIGNEENLSQGLPSHDARFTQFYKAIKVKYPELKLISAVPTTVRDAVRTTPADVIDDHYYQTAAQLAQTGKRYDSPSFRTPGAPKIFVGEWASRQGDPTSTFDAALGDAAFLTGLERNADVIIMSCYAPLLTNVNPGGQQWSTDLIGYDTMNSFGSTSYYVQQMFAANRGDKVLPVNLRSDSADIFASATRDEKTNDVILKFVNRRGGPVTMTIDLAGAKRVSKSAAGEQLTASALTDVNTVKEPRKVAPKKVEISNAAAQFMTSFPASSVTVLRLKSKVTVDNLKLFKGSTE